ncbi:drug resistance transporter, EmrB/QacA subfamily [Geoglobus ahangari]|uniref:Drug resistance transporter, EmrB/QacA subfamily n=1 Tax=Geoglobus ahangari TaxID=113653 RepID=A0A0F7DBN0_9EURY|nr:MFS transporter [Geoglobus ahangari]AKG91376.1 drug resistance transporter, EmrB/QacA subfamily [Geoglobus ahangari]
MSRSGWLGLIPVGMGLFMVLLDVSVLNVALPSIARDFNARMSDIQWILNSYTLTMVVLLVLAGRIGDMVRRDRYFMGAMALFTVSSFLCAQAWSTGSLIFFRVLQAVGGAMLSGNTLAIITELFPPGKRGAAMGLNSILVASSFTLGPIIGGWLTTHLSWHWVFYLNVPVGIVSVILAYLLLPPLGAKEKVPVDFAGAVLLAVALGSLTLGIINGQDWGWRDEKTLGCFAISIPYLIAFALRELSYEYPLLDLSLFRIRNFTVGILAVSILFFGMSSSLFVLPYFLQGIKSLSAADSGYWMIVLPLVNTVFSPLAGRLSDRINPKYLMCAGPVLFTLGMYNLSGIEENVSYWEFFVKLMPMGIGMGMLMSPSFNVIMASVPPEKAGMANGTVRSVNTLSQAMGVTVGGVLLTNRMKDWLGNYGNQIPDPGTMALLRVLALKGNPLPLVAMVESFMDSMHYLFSVMMWLPLLSMLVILLFLSGEEHLRRMRVLAVRKGEVEG